MNRLHRASKPLPADTERCTFICLEGTEWAHRCPTTAKSRGRCNRPNHRPSDEPNWTLTRINVPQTVSGGA